MPISKAAKKALRSSTKKHQQNNLFKQNFKKIIKATNVKNLDKAYSAIDKACKKHLIHRNKAARLKSRLAKKFVKVEPVKKTKKVQKAKKTKVAKKQLKNN